MVNNVVYYIFTKIDKILKHSELSYMEGAPGTLNENENEFPRQ